MSSPSSSSDSALRVSGWSMRDRGDAGVGHLVAQGRVRRADSSDGEPRRHRPAPQAEKWAVPLFTLARGRRYGPPMSTAADRSSSPTSPPGASTSSSPTSTSAARVDPQLRDQGARAPRRGVGGDDLPRLGLHAHGRARLPRPRQARGVRRRRAATTTSSSVLAEEIVHARSGGLAMGVAVQTDMAMPPILAFGTEEQKQRVARARDPRREDPRAWASPSPTRGPTWPASRPAPCATATSTSSTARRPTSPTATART